MIATMQWTSLMSLLRMLNNCESNAGCQKVADSGLVNCNPPKSENVLKVERNGHVWPS